MWLLRLSSRYIFKVRFTNINPLAVVLAAPLNNLCILSFLNLSMEFIASTNVMSSSTQHFFTQVIGLSNIDSQELSYLTTPLSIINFLYPHFPPPMGNTEVQKPVLLLHSLNNSCFWLWSQVLSMQFAHSPCKCEGFLKVTPTSKICAGRLTGYCKMQDQLCAGDLDVGKLISIWERIDCKKIKGSCLKRIALLGASIFSMNRIDTFYLW